MVSITRLLRSVSLRLLLTLVLAVGAAGARAGSIEPIEGLLIPGEDGYTLSAEFKIDLGMRLEEAVAHGVPLNFNFEFTLVRKRWYWFDEHIASRAIDYRLTYNALTQQYRLSVAGLHSSFGTLAEALRVLGHVGGLVVVDTSEVKSTDIYVASLRLSLDKSQLPKPFQLDALASRDWQVDAKTRRWQFAPGGVGK
jgi:hypothetical protein